MSQPANESALSVVAWAHDRAADDETVRMFWRKLCEAVREPEAASASRVLSELRAYGGNTIANFFRGGGVDYDEVAYDVAEVLRPLFGDAPYRFGDVAACESYVLDRMAVSDDDLIRLCEAIATRGREEALEEGVKSVVTMVGTRAAAGAVARGVAGRAAEAAAERAAAEVARHAAQKTAEKMAGEVAKRILARVLTALNIVFAVWTVIELAGPARRVTLAAVTYVALLRQLRARTAAGLRPVRQS